MPDLSSPAAMREACAALCDELLASADAAYGNTHTDLAAAKWMGKAQAAEDLAKAIRALRVPSEPTVEQQAVAWQTIDREGKVYWTDENKAEVEDHATRNNAWNHLHAQQPFTVRPLYAAPLGTGEDSAPT